MNFDLRLPIGLLFTVYGLILSGYGLCTKGSVIYESSLGMNINLIWGVVMLAFGVLMLALALRGKASASSKSDDSTASKKVEPPDRH